MPASTDAPPFRDLWPRFVRFWFRPSDPTTMGFVRLVTGLICVYVHLAYTFDLRTFFGPDAWVSLETINRERRENPTLYPALGWDDDRSTARVPDYPHRRAAVMAHLRAVGGRTPAQVEKELAWMDRLVKTNNGITFATGMGYVLELSADPADRELQLGVLRDESTRAKATAAVKPPTQVRETPLVVLGLPPDELRKAADEVAASYASLPADPTDRQYVVNHLRELDPASRKATVELMHRLATLPKDQQEEELSYLESWGLEKRLVGRVGDPKFSIWYHVTDPAGQVAAHVVCLVIFALFAAGLWTRVTAVLAWLAAVSYIHRSQQILFGMDTMLNILLFYLMFADAGRSLSIDRLILRYRAAKQALARSGTIDPATAAYLRAPLPSAASTFAQRGIQVHFCFIYMASALSKLKGPAWWNHHAYWDTLVNPEFTPVQHAWYEALVRELVGNRPVYALMAAGGIAVTFIAELGLPFLVWTRLRPYILLFAFLLHAGVAVFMGLWVFSLLMMTLMLAYLPGAAIRTQLFGPPGPVKARWKLADRSPASVETAARVKTFDWQDEVEVGEGVTGHDPAAVRAALPWVGRRFV